MAQALNRCGLWFGTEKYMQWIETPQSGAESTPEAWRSSGTFLNGGGYSFHSWGSHKVYDYAWRNSSAREAADLMQAYRSGTYGKGLIYFVDPLTYDTNVLPARWADPSIVLRDEGKSHIYGKQPRPFNNAGFRTNRLPVESTSYTFSTADPFGVNVADSVFVPIPEGYVLRLGAFYSATGSAGVFATEVNLAGVNGATTQLTQVSSDAKLIAPDSFSGNISGVRLWFGRLGSAPASLTVSALVGRLVAAERNDVTWTDANAPEIVRGPWSAGQGHSGCRFDSEPTYIEYNGMNGGQIGYAATFREVGDWEFA